VGILKFERNPETKEIYPLKTGCQIASSQYSGQVNEEGQPHGIGREIRKDGSIAEGQFTYGWLNGWGR